MASIMPVLARMRLFEGLGQDELDLVESQVFVNRFRGGEIVCREGDLSDFVCFVVEGELDIVKLNDDGQEVMIAQLSSGDSMGEIALVDQEPRSATVRAAEDATLVVLTRKGLEQLRSRSPRAVSLIMENVARLLCAYLRRTSSQLAQFKLPGR